MSDYRSVNRALWDERAPAHAASRDYGFTDFADDPTYLSEVVRFDLPRLGDISGLRGAHLQCHIGTDTVSLSRLGARMTGLDFSAESVKQARLLAKAADADIDFVESDVYDAVTELGAGAFDLVFTGVGALCWLPSITRWAQVVADLLRPEGRLFLREGHPVMWALEDPRPDGLLVLDFPYFEVPDATVWSEGGTYVDTDVTFHNTVSHSWNHGIGEIVTALSAAGMELTMLVEHDTVPWDAFPGMMTHLDNGEWRLTERPNRLPLTYTLQARKRA
jgi:SAM-dependent methyltransferase